VEEAGIKKVFAERLKNLREEKELTQNDLANALNVSRGSISFYENAERMAGIDFAHKAACFFKCTPDYLFGLSNDKNRYEQERTELIEEKLFRQLYRLPSDVRNKLLSALEESVNSALKLDEGNKTIDEINRLSTYLWRHSIMLIHAIEMKYCTTKDLYAYHQFLKDFEWRSIFDLEEKTTLINSVIESLDDPDEFMKLASVDSFQDNK